MAAAMLSLCIFFFVCLFTQIHHTCGKWHSKPLGVTVSDEGEIFVADWTNMRIQVFNLQGTSVREFSTVVPDEDDIYIVPTMQPHDVAMDWEGNLWVVGRHPTESVDLAVKYDKQGKALSNFSLPETDLDAEVRNGVAVDTRTKHILITQTKEEGVQGEVLVFEPDGTRVKTVGQDDLKQPRYVTVDGEGNIFVSDAGDSHSLKDTGTVYAYNKDGEFLAQFGSEGNSPRGICTDKAGNIIVADKADKRVDMFDKTGKFLKHVVTGMSGRPQAVAMAPQGQLVLTDVEHHRVIIFPESVLNSNDDQSKTVISL